MKNLFIVESPSKAKTIQKYLGDDYKVLSSYGHIRDLAKSEMSIDIEHQYEPKYQVGEDKHKLVVELKREAKKAEVVWLASDEDREGEAIAWHLRETLEIAPEKAKRIVFNEITKGVILEALEHPRDIDMNLVNAQQARRVLDRLVGYEISPILWQKIKPSLSAGRVQSVAVRLTVEREEEIKNFKAKSNYRIVGFFDDNGRTLQAECTQRPADETQAHLLLESLAGKDFAVCNLVTKPARRSPAAPFTTSTLQQEASRKLGYSVSRTMQLAQQLYEGGHITYMRTDSTNISKVALAMAKEAITQEYGETYVKLRQYTTKVKGAQEAHEAIRPTNLKAATVLAEPAQKRLYELIWKRTIASQMADAELEKTVVTVEADGTTASFESKGERVLFDGFIKVYTESYDDEEENGEEQHMLPNVKRGDKVVLQKATAVQAYTQHPPRYTEASLVRKLEELGIGRPSTYAPTVSTILKREYVDKQDLEPRVQQAVLLTLNGDGALTREVREEKTGLEKNKLVPTDIGVLVNQFLMEHFPEIIDYNFTADVEKDFDEIARGKKDWRNVIAHFYEPFHKNVEVTQQTSKRTSGERLLGIDPKSGKNVYAKVGRFGPLIQIGDTKAEEKPRFASMKRGQSISTITLDEALDLFALPRTVGEWEGKPVVVSVGRFGPYVKYDNAYYSLGKNDDPYAVELQRCQEIIAEKRAANEDKERLKKLLPKELGKFENETIVVNIGKYGPYLVYKQANYRLPKTLKDPTTLRLEEAIEVIRSHAGKKPTKERARKKQ